ncbi:unnamed protein product, partial [Rotaria sp. Silwood1]
MRSTVIVWAGLVLLGSIWISQCQGAYNDDIDEMDSGELDFELTGRLEQLYTYKALLKFLS